MKPLDVIIHNTSEILRCDGDVRGPAEAALSPQKRGVLGVCDQRVAYIGPSIPTDLVSASTQFIDAHGGFVGPGLVDCHTHVVFAGDRSDEFELRCQGKSYLEIAEGGGGIQKTVHSTRQASPEELAQGAKLRLDRLMRQGVTTVEIKSGYGLDLETELKMLRVIAQLGQTHPLTIIGTFLGLHTVPAEFASNRAGYVQLAIDTILPQVAAQRLARFCDAFVEQTAFTHDEATAFLLRAKALGLMPRLHVDQLTANRGAELAARLGAVTADHLEQIDAEGIVALKQSGTIAVLAPTSTLFAKCRPFAPGRLLRDAGVAVALCTNCNPGSSMSENVYLAMGLGCVENGLTPAEAYLGFTRVAAMALNEPHRGQLRVGGPADVVVYQSESYRSLPYHFAMNDVQVVIKDGRVV